MSIKIQDNYGRTRPVFSKIILKSKTACRFCQSTFEVKTRKERRDYTPEDKAKFMMSSGDTAFRMVTASGPTGTAYVCHNCVRELMENIAEELGSKIL